MFFDEKIFWLDGTDKLACFWHDLRKEARRFLTHQQGGAPLMIWVAVPLYEQSELVFVESNLNYEQYCSILAAHFHPMDARTFCKTSFWTFQQDVASIHCFVYSAGRLRAQRVSSLKLPVKSHNFNIIEKVWDFMDRWVLSNGKQYDSTDVLKEGIWDFWQNLVASYIRDLYHSNSRRLLTAIDYSGRATKY